MQPLILTGRIDSASQKFFNALRDEHFPPERNFLSAHLTLFHALPGSECAQVQNRLRHAAGSAQALEAEITGLRSLGRGVAYNVACPALTFLRSSLVNAFYSFLVAQDRQSWRPHITVQNKVNPDAARALLLRLQASFKPTKICIEGLDLWRYEEGPWSLIESYPFEIA